jgi:hypothetical protein
MREDREIERRGKEKRKRKMQGVSFPPASLPL